MIGDFLNIYGESLFVFLVYSHKWDSGLAFEAG